jgi:uncharacterized protein
MEQLKLTWRDVETITKRVGRIIISDQLKFDYIVPIGRGGFIPGVILSHYLGLPMHPIMYQTRDGGIIDGIDVGIKDDIANGKSILLLDDINDSGNTFLAILEEWDYNENSKGEVITAAVLQRHTTAAPAGIVGRTVNDNRWVVFPWEKK